MSVSKDKAITEIPFHETGIPKQVKSMLQKYYGNKIGCSYSDTYYRVGDRVSVSSTYRLPRNGLIINYLFNLTTNSVLITWKTKMMYTWGVLREIAPILEEECDDQDDGNIKIEFNPAFNYVDKPYEMIFGLKVTSEVPLRANDISARLQYVETLLAYGTGYADANEKGYYDGYDCCTYLKLILEDLLFQAEKQGISEDGFWRSISVCSPLVIERKADNGFTDVVLCVGDDTTLDIGSYSRSDDNCEELRKHYLQLGEDLRLFLTAKLNQRMLRQSLL